ncbi:MAG: hypothetical protein LBM93_12975 [Oscillospiraceae bacterium]|jgi:hypothetical protein|nr:hypothetical protein [Oscillospiraceae bacterium]
MNKAAMVLLIIVLIAVFVFFHKFLDTSRGMFKIGFFAFLLILVIVARIFVKIGTNGKNVNIAQAKVLYLYDMGNGILGCVCEWQAEQGLITATLALQNREVRERLKAAFPIKEYAEPGLAMSYKRYMETKGYKRWIEELPSGFEYPEMTVQYNEKSPRLLVNIIG